MRPIKTRHSFWVRAFLVLAIAGAGQIVTATTPTGVARAAETAAAAVKPTSVQKTKTAAKNVAAVTKTPKSAPAVKSDDGRAGPARIEAAKAAKFPLKPSDGFFIDGRFVRVEAFHGQGQGQLPAVIILHGASGLGDGTLFYPQAAALAERGISAFIVHYFDGLPVKRNAASPALHDQRERIVSQALNYVEALNYVDGGKIGVYGLSLGGFQALSLASRDDRIAAVVDVIGAMPSQVARDGVLRMPPTMILHGDRDRTVPVKRAHELAQLLETLGTPYEMKIYHGESHYFRIAAREDSIREAADFFDRHLRAPS